MFCTRCGAKVADGTAFCTACGNPMTGIPAAESKPVTAATAQPVIRMNGLSRAGSVEPEVSLEPRKPVAETPAAHPAPVVPPTTPKMAPPAPMAPTAPPAAPRMVPPAPMAPTAPPAAPRMAPPAPMAPTAPPAAPRMAPPAPPVAPPAPPVAPPVPTPPPAPKAEDRRISPKRELKLLLHQGWLVMLGERRNLIISLLFPVIAALIIVWIAGENMFENYESTKSACFIVVCSAIWGGLFNSIQSIVKERENIKRDYVSGALRIECYTASRAILQLVLCLVQSFVLSLSIPIVGLVYGNDVPSTGALGLPAVIEYFLTIFLIMYASDAMGLMISAFVKKDELASKLAPYILIAQLLFSGVLFAMEGAAQLLSGVMVSRWGMEALGSISDLNDLPLRIQDEYPELKAMIEHEAEDAFSHDPGHLLLVWLILLVFIAVPLVVCNYCLHNVKKDTRS